MARGKGLLLVLCTAACSDNPLDTLQMPVSSTRHGVGTVPSSMVACTSDVTCAMPVIAAGGHHTLVLRGDGTVWAAGANLGGQLGDGTTTSAKTPVAVAGLSDVTAIAAGGAHSLALKRDGTVVAWGRNDFGQLGSGTATGECGGSATGGGVTTPVVVTGLSGVAAIAAGDSHSLALKTDGTVVAWGANCSGQLGNGATGGGVTTPVAVTGLSGVTAVAVPVGGYHSLALKADGTVMAWGANNTGQLGNGMFSGGPTMTAVAVTGLSGVIAIAAGDTGSLFGLSLALKADGTVVAWGYNGSGQLGNGATGGGVTTPVAVTDLSGVIAIAAGAAHSVALKTDGTVVAWGYNFYGQLGNEGTASVSLPAPSLLAFRSGCGEVPTCNAGVCGSSVCSGNGTCGAGVCVCSRPGTAGALCTPTICAVNQRVQSNLCVACAPGSTRPAGDNATGADTSCTDTRCAVNQRVQDNACVACAPGSTRPAGDNATGADTSCTATNGGGMGGGSATGGADSGGVQPSSGLYGWWCGAGSSTGSTAEHVVALLAAIAVTRRSRVRRGRSAAAGGLLPEPTHGH